MPRIPALVGREQELAELVDAIKEPSRGGLILLAGEAGMGKTRLADEAMAGTNVLALRGGAGQESTEPYGPVLAALRAYLRVDPQGLEDIGPLKGHLALLLPELGRARKDASSATILEALRCAFETIAGGRASCVLLDDLHWADETTLLEVLPMLASALANGRLLVVGIYRNDEIPRGHPLRRLRRDLRRAGRLRELVLEPLDSAGTAGLAAQTLGGDPAPALAAALHERTQGVPFFVEELAGALVASGRVRHGRHGMELAEGEEVPLPDTVRDAVLLRAAALSDEARAVLEVAAVAGLSFELPVVVDLAGEAGLDEAIESGIVLETEPGWASFRHALTREALHGDVRWTRRRALHRRYATYLGERGAPPSVIAEHWLAAHDNERAAPVLVAATTAYESVHAYRDALRVGRRAVELWPEAKEEPARLALLDRVARCAELCGDLNEAIVAWREVADGRRLAGDGLGAAEAERQLATAYDLQGASERALVARRAAADAFSDGGLPGEAATELLAAAANLDSAGNLEAALELIEWARSEAVRSGRLDLQARVLGVEGTVRAKLGQIDSGLEAARAGLELALSEDLVAPAAEAYQRVANVLENAGDYRAAWDAYQTAYDFCEAQGASAAAQVCLVCLGFILVFTAEWDRAIELDRTILASPDSPLGVKMGAKQHIGLIGAARGETKRSRKLLSESGAYAARFDRERMAIWDAMGHAWLDELEGSTDSAIERCRFILARWGESESLHYPVPALRWATTFLATNGADDDARACAAALAALASKTVNPEALAALGHALGETALLDGDADEAAAHFERALGVLRELELPFEAAQTQARAGVAFVKAGDRNAGVEHLVAAYRTARRLGAKPLALRVTRELEAIGEPVERRLGRKAAASLSGPGLSRRELEVMRLVADGRTNREIAHEFFVSPRTVDMHVRNIFVKLGCRSRAEATRKAVDLGLLA
jgi:DNA-binding CsgD family transcriptional regulator/tetratricopeptide (TPR) repeat protein